MVWKHARSALGGFAVLLAASCGDGRAGAGAGAVPAADAAPAGAAAPAAAETAAPDPGPQPTFISLLPWGEVDFARGEFPSRDACTAFVRALPGYSGYTSPERCERIDDPVYCTVWRDPDDPRDRMDCFRGVGGCEVELRRHDLLAESRGRTLAARCEPTPLADAWARHQALAPDAEP